MATVWGDPELFGLRLEDRIQGPGRISGSAVSHFLPLFGRGGTLFQLRDTGEKDKIQLEDPKLGCDEFWVLLRTLKKVQILLTVETLKGQCCWPLESSWSGDRSCGSLGTITYQEEAVFGHGRGRRETKMGAPGLGIQGHFQNCNSSSRGPDVLFCHPQVPGMHVAPEHKEIHLAVARVRQ